MWNITPAINLINKWRYAALIFAFSLGLWLLFFQKQPELPHSHIGQDVSSILKAMPKNDRENLEYFFREMIHTDCFGYVLFGEKPMALGSLVRKINPFACFWEKEPQKAESTAEYSPRLFEKFFWYFNDAISPRRYKCNKGYETWKKYEKIFPMNRFTIFCENHHHVGGENLTIILVNNSSFIQMVREHRDDFKAILNKEADGEALLKEGSLKPLLSEVLMDHDGLIGIMLGYGRDNAFLFHQKYQIASCADTEQLGSAWTDEETAIFSKQLESISWMSEHITGSHLKDLELISLPGFRADPSSSETQSLRRHYLKTRQAIIDYYKDKDFLEATLKILTS